ncbi:uncharacterized protein EV420DRAFT_1158643 [Desarmillaria tabescens]|uniref:Tse2 ADP-ribosyltransferase toxin domain-containing protein n=1 Tax=Armillaria tabescens TaxID=1929756 RepID=A0AA39NCJ6_ARMTA|nr:uncharacterized protein EV420DRAFT_1158643 [Desarmillaria tabescens]KAK0463147.1 hypothetical protein EV420DRAFT_1158643 [Desarmillaria tabescens]
MITTRTHSVFRSLSWSIRFKSSSARPENSSFYKPLLGRYDYLPCELFRINASKKIILRDYNKQIESGRISYDLRTHEDGLVHPKPGPMFEGPNGASVRPNGAFLQELVRTFRGKNTVIYRLPEGTKLPSDLVCLHEHTDHHSIQCAVPMTLRELNAKVTEFCHKYGEAMTKEEFVERYPFI